MNTTADVARRSLRFPSPKSSTPYNKHVFNEISSIEMLHSLLASFMHLTLPSITSNAALVTPGDFGKSETQFESVLLEGRLKKFETNLYALPLIWYSDRANDFISGVYLFPLFFFNVGRFEDQ
jgi:hypothetical protein